MMSKSCLLLIVGLLGQIDTGLAVSCFECSTSLGQSQWDSCLSGDILNLRRVVCMGPSVCAAYHYQTGYQGGPITNHMSRGCQALRFGGTCEDIFHELRQRNELLSGQHTCITCSTDFCNSAGSLNFNLGLGVVVLVVLYFVGF